MNKISEAVRRSRSNQKKKLIAAFGGKCCCCGLKDDDCIYDFHHSDPITKTFEINAGAAFGWDRIVTEAKKCVMICCLCHRKVHKGVLKIPADAQSFDSTLIPAIPRSPHPGRTWSVGSRKGIKMPKNPSVVQWLERSPDKREKMDRNHPEGP